MYKVFYNDRHIIICSEQCLNRFGSTVPVYYVSSAEDISSRLENFYLSDEGRILLYGNMTADELLAKFMGVFRYCIPAAGGIVQNKRGEYLFIYRYKRWDIPKGKLDKNETPEQGAVREVSEETGLKNLLVARQLQSTYHIHNYKGAKALKQTYWYLMLNEGNEVLKPQRAEGITGVKWIQRRKLPRMAEKTYASLRELITPFIQQP